MLKRAAQRKICLFVAMGPFLIIVFVLASVRLSDARSLGRRVPTYGGVEEKPQRKYFRSSAQQVDSLQLTDNALSWRFPEAPEDPVIRPVKFDMRPLVPTNRMAVRCGESRIQVELRQDLLGLSKLIEPDEIMLGGCSPTEFDDMAHVIAFESELHGCGSTLVMTENAFIYAFTLVYNPKVLDNSGITRSQSAVIGVECHYPRRTPSL